MTWSYDLTALSTTPLFQVRYLVGDTVQTDQQVADEEINFLLTLRANIYGVAADVCRSLSSQMSRKVDLTSGAGGVTNRYSQKATAYLRMALLYENKATETGAGAPYAGGISVADKMLQEMDPDRVAPQFNLGMDDDLIPTGPVGNETSTGAAQTGADEVP